MSFLLVKTINDFSSVDYFMFFLIAIISSLLMVFVGYKLLQIIQLSGYKLSGFMMWFKETKFSYFVRLFMLSFLSIASMLMTNVLLDDFFIVAPMHYIAILFFVLFSSFFIFNLFSAKQKTPLKYTKRMTRFTIVYAILIFIATLLVELLGVMFIPYLSYGLVAILPILLPLISLLAYFITYPFEKLISNSFLKRSKKKLSGLKNLKVIGITGSYGKTTVKKILFTILSEKFKVCATPSSFNTPLGLSKTILNHLSIDDEIFIAEMGAKQKNDINELCEMVKPSIALITGIGNQHLLTFGSVENIINTKGELAEYVTKNNGKLYICTESEGAKKLAENYQNATLVSLEKKSELFISNISIGAFGSKFNLCHKNSKVSCETILLGEHNIANIYLCACVAFDLGLSLEEIAEGIKKIKPISHRLEIIKNEGSFLILDDAYNSSVQGSEASLKVLSNFSGKKVVVTPGLVELGKEQFNSNFEFGRNLARVANLVVIDSNINYDAISSGLLFEGFDEGNIIQTPNLASAVEILKNYVSKDDVVLFENDLPDNYN